MKGFAGLIWVAMGMLLLGFVPGSKAAILPQYELGGFWYDQQYPHYLGSNEYGKAGEAMPYFIFRSPIVDFGGENRLYLLDSNLLSFRLEMKNLRSIQPGDPNEAAPTGIDNPQVKLIRQSNFHRRGMDYIPPALVTTFAANLYLGGHLSFHFPTSWETLQSQSQEYGGRTYATGVSWDFFGKESQNSFVVRYSKLYGDETYNQRLYSVPAHQALPGRPAYLALGGLLSKYYSMDYGFYPYPWMYVGGGWMRFDMTQSVVRDSPLVVAPQGESLYFTLILKLVWGDRGVIRYK